MAFKTLGILPHAGHRRQFNLNVSSALIKWHRKRLEACVNVPRLTQALRHRQGSKIQMRKVRGSFNLWETFACSLTKAHHSPAGDKVGAHFQQVRPTGSAGAGDGLEERGQLEIF